MYQIYIFTYNIVVQVALILTADVLVSVDDGVKDEEALELWAERAIKYNNRLMEINNYI